MFPVGQSGPGPVGPPGINQVSHISQMTDSGLRKRHFHVSPFIELKLNWIGYQPWYRYWRPLKRQQRRHWKSS